MSNAEVRILSDIDLVGALVFSQNPTDFPTDPKPNTLIVKAGMPWVYSNLDGFNTWRPLINLNSFYIHTQAVASDMWNINHNLGTVYFISIAYDDTGNVMYPAQIIPNMNGLTYQMRFAVPVTGTVVVFAAATGFGNGGTDTLFGGIVSTALVVKSGRYYLLDSTAGVSLPALPSLGDRITFYDNQDPLAFSSITILGNGNPVQGVVGGNALMDLAGYKAEFVYAGGAKGWSIY